MTTGRKVLLVDDDEALRGTLAEQLQLHEEFDTSEAGTGAEGLEAAKTATFDLILLDVGLPDMDGRDLCRLMRKAGVKSPVIMLTAQDSDADTILGLDAGANDYVTKPFKVAVLLARMRAQLRQHEQSDDAVFSIGPYAFKPAAKLMVDETKNRKIRLTEKETAILKYLYRAGDRMVRRETLLNEVWGYNAGVTTHTLETHVYRLRQKIEPDPSRAEILVTDTGGYRLVP
ncbi:MULTISPECIES: response regulator transcription factor [Thalassobaculum]|uniref:DNA-binding response regulator, OmpR family, contains REC and winged-helix (WHTH) domain n=1 Tax=Thalassobaculum litoreum DSM 18839 TaxID=1123362 RepID=A0A8G2BLZ3_9PROT|nr:MULTISPECIES: response regulator transcription factor [Thalassobaculum]SDG12023.1 DNA-binding response regulator, OmpR family, contains REC and winged-helix (wHTH) domain [Thalassobaculum litoreum DSM 18839]